MGVSLVHRLVGSIPSLALEGGATPSPSPSDITPEEVTEKAVKVTGSVLGVFGGIGLGLAVGVVVAVLLQILSRALMRKSNMLRAAARPAARPLRLALALAAGWAGMLIASPMSPGEEEPDWRRHAQHAFLIACIAAVTWLIANVVLGVQELMLVRLKETGQSRYRKVQTQLQVLNRAISVAIWLLGGAAILMTFPVARAAGASVFASAGLISVVAGIAAQSTLGNLFAGLQLAFSDSIRMGDIVIWKTEYTKVEEITLTYVVLKVWDGRRLIVPSKELTTQTFENWTRRTPEMLGYVDFQLDWSVPIPQMRAELDRILAGTDLWDGDTGIIQVRTAEGTSIQVSALVSAASPSELIDLKFFVRERLVRWIQDQAPDAMPHSRSFSDPDPLAEGSDGPAKGEESPVEATDGTRRGEIGQRKGDVAKEGVESGVGRSGGKNEKPTGVARTMVLPAKDVPPAPGRPGGKAGGGIVPSAGQSQSPADRKSKAEAAATRRVSIAQRVKIEEAVEAARQTDSPPLAETGYESAIFAGSAGAEKRAREFAGPGEDALRERDEAGRRKEERHSGEDDRLEETATFDVDEIAAQDADAPQPEDSEKRRRGEG